MGDVRHVFEKITLDFEEATSKLSCTAEIIHRKVFDSAIVKAQSGNAHAT